MRTIAVKCPNCSAALNLEEGRTSYFCQYCGTPVILDDESVRINITNRIVDEAQVKAVDLEKQKFEQRQVNYESFQEKEAEWKKILLLWLGAIGISFFLYFIFQNVSFLAFLAEGLFGVILIFGGIGVWSLKPKNVSDPSAPEQPSYRLNPDFSSSSQKNRLTAFVICLFLGILGGHYFYVGRYKNGLIYLFTGGLLGLGWMYDMAMIAFGRFADSRGRLLK